ncbi:DUF29 domain-containing protein [Planktothrix sp. FACHB-1355]|uniref:DUF29 domain-containing protein n=1 Tax=Aerosakkonema funiforme FACHB-1375 TaxID=2949571 RepID=A0A926VDN3_9CYAN|nr:MULTISPECIES: DUF29 domain-containing protein [Oscillatoriales]MBD2181443.1 DUF29 domain-containing protein [Aerosakkonema funiforme FACHB-1375]MBD3558710.1 DUF29 domain-containing protein [Planktothrix sp. FACHB-1355]
MTVSQSKNETANLYDRDYYLWTEEIAKILRQGRFADLDVKNLLLEIEEMGKREKRAVESNLVVVLLHLLKYKYQPEKRSGSWEGSMREHRRRLNRELDDSPSLRPYLETIFDSCYQNAREQAKDETRLPVETFPVNSPFTLEESLNPDFLPEAED